MFTGQLSWTEVFGGASQLAPGSNVVNGNGSGAAFALLFAEVLVITKEFGDEAGESGLTSGLANYVGPSSPSSGAYIPPPAQNMSNSQIVPDVDPDLTPSHLAAVGWMRTPSLTPVTIVPCFAAWEWKLRG
jgi:hypothetical protein